MQLTKTGVAIEILAWMLLASYTWHQRNLTNVPTTPLETSSGLLETDPRTRQTLHMCVRYKSGGMISFSRCSTESLHPTIQRAGIVSKTSDKFDYESNNKKLASGHSIRTTFKCWCFSFFVRFEGIVGSKNGGSVDARTSTLPTTFFSFYASPYATSHQDRQC